MYFIWNRLSPCLATKHTIRRTGPVFARLVWWKKKKKRVFNLFSIHITLYIYTSIYTSMYTYISQCTLTSCSDSFFYFYISLKVRIVYWMDIPRWTVHNNNNYTIALLPFSRTKRAHSHSGTQLFYVIQKHNSPHDPDYTHARSPNIIINKALLRIVFFFFCFSFPPHIDLSRIITFENKI
jgi:hypothetical protein